MTPTFDFFFSFRSPYSYLALVQMRGVVRDYDVEAILRPVYPIAVRIPGFFKSASPLFGRYVVRDSRRAAEHAGIPFHWPRPDPVVQDTATMEIAREQPLIHRLTRLCAAAQKSGRSWDFTQAIAPVLWDGSVVGWNEGDYLARAATAAGFDLDAMDAAVTNEPERFDAVIAQNEADHEAAGHWGVPTFALQGEPFFGQDRIETLVWRMTQHGLVRRETRL